MILYGFDIDQTGIEKKYKYETKYRKAVQMIDNQYKEI